MNNNLAKNHEILIAIEEGAIGGFGNLKRGFKTVGGGCERAAGDYEKGL